MSEISTKHLEVIRNPRQEYLYSIGPSGHHGIGIFASRDIGSGEKISVFLWPTKPGARRFIRDESCRFCNHKEESNASVLSDGDKYSLFANCDIKSGEEIYINYLQSVACMMADGLFELPTIVRCRTMKYIPYATDPAGRSLADEIKEIAEGAWR